MNSYQEQVAGTYLTQNTCRAIGLNTLTDGGTGEKMTSAVQIQELTKVYADGKKALDSLSMEISRGEIFGFLGPNGSGKTTTIRLLNGVLEPTSGTAHLMGLSVKEQSGAIRGKCGVLTETAAPYEHLTAPQNLTFFGKLNGMSSTEIEERQRFLLEYFQLAEHIGKSVKTFSTGMRKRLCLAIAMLHRPQLLFLDEPTSGLDPEAARQVTRLIQKVSQEEGVTVFLCTHQLKYAEDICTRFGFIHQGRMVGFGSLHDLRAATADSCRLIVRGSDIPESLGFSLTRPGRYEKNIAGDGEAAELLAKTIQAGGTVFEARQEYASLEDLYFSFQEKFRREEQNLGDHS